MAKILFISKLWYESLAVMQLSAVAKQAGHESYLYMDNGNTRRLLKFVNELKPSLIGFSFMTGQHLWALRTAKLLKDSPLSPKPLIVFGGPHPTFVPQIIEDTSVDIVCRGEGEEAILDLLNAVDNKKDFSRIPNLWVKQEGQILKNEPRPLVKDLDFLPFLDREIFYRYSYFRDAPVKMMMTSRGCPFNCSFCFNEKYRELYNIPPDYIRRRSCQNVIDELKTIKTRYKKTKIIKFHDDIFTLDKLWLLEFLDIYKKEIGIPFVCYVRAGLDDEKTIKKLAEAGCRRVGFGVETGDEQLRNIILRKGVSNQQIYNLADILKRYKIPFFTNTIFFIPRETINNVWETVRVNQRIKPNYVANHIFQIYPGTVIAKDLIDRDLINENYLRSWSNMYALSPLVSEAASCTNTKMNIYYFYPLIVKFPFLTKIIKPLIGLKPNIFFLTLFKITAGVNHCLRNSLSFSRFLREAYRNLDFK